jgi:hypothetical protein
MRRLHRQSRRTGMLTFLRGDPTGGYWQFNKTV